ALGNIAYDRWNRQVFVTDLETGMIHRFAAADGRELGVYDHGLTGRQNFLAADSGTRGALAPMAFDPNTSAQIGEWTFGRFDNSPECWNVADFRRRVYGIGVRRDARTQEVRLYYSVWSSPSLGQVQWMTAEMDDQRSSVWSIKLDATGGFDPTDIRREFALP